jgi:hypothetical protein
LFTKFIAIASWHRGVSAMAAHKADERRAIMQAAIARNSDLAVN